MSDTTQGQDAAVQDNVATAAPDVDELFPKQDVDELFPPDYKPTNQPVRNVSPIQDMLFSNPGRAHARILDAFGYGFKQDWGAGQQEFSEADEWLRKAGIWNDYAKGQRSIIKAANETIMRPAVAAILAAKSTASGLFAGAQAAVAQTGEEYGFPNLARELAAMPEAFPAGVHQAEGIPHAPEPAPINTVMTIKGHEFPFLPDTIAAAKDLDVIGAGEDGYFGTKPAIPEAVSTEAEAAKTAGVTAKDWNETLLGQKPSGATPSPIVQPAPIAAAAEAIPGEARPAAPSPVATAIPQAIVDDVKKKLMAAGRPEEEAEAAAQIIASHYRARAERFEGAKGTPEELYEAEGPIIRRGEGVAPVAPSEPELNLPGGAAAESPKVIEEAAPADRASLEKLLAENAPASEIAEHPIVKAAQEDNRARPMTRDLPGYGTPEFQENREFNFGGEKVKGYAAATDRLVAGAKSFSTKGPVKNDREATIVLGPPASGKSRLSETFARERHAAIVDSDEAKKAIPEYDGGAGTTAVHEESADLTFGENGVLERLMDEGSNLVLPKVGHTADSIRQIVAGLKADGYRVNLVNMNVAPEEAYRRMIRRFLKTGRVIGSDYFGSVGDKPTQTYYTLKGEGGLHESADIDVNGPVGTERFIDGKETSLEANLRSGRDREQEDHRDVGPAAVPQAEVTHAEPVNAALEAADQVNSLSPAEQKRELPKYSPAAETAPKGPDQPAGVFMFDPTALDVDAKRFQFKSGGDEYGVTGALRNVTKWDPAKAQAIIVWEQNDGQLFVADGHQRAGLARRLTEQGKAKDIQLPGILYREKDGVSAADIRAVAAVTNIANGSGSALDGAKVLRARPDLMDGSLPLSVGKGKQAAALARLSDEPFRMVVNDVVPEHYGAVVGELIPNDAARQEAALKAIARFEPKNADEAAVLTQRVAQAELAKKEAGSQGSMFGDLETAESTAGEEMKIVGRAIGDLKKDRALFARVLANAERIEQTGSQIEREAAKGVASDAEVFAKTLTSEAYSAGPLRTELVKAARDLKNGKATLGEATGRILAALRRQAEAHGADRPRAVEREPEREFAQTDDLFEAGAEGKPQQLIPGVAPLTQRDLIQAAANKPLKPKVAQKEVGGLFGDSMDQKELFQTKRGQIRLREDAKPIITLFKDANASTFIHETGHQWLEELMADAAEDKAPAGLKADADAVLKWLGVDDAEAIKTRHHEQFARGFETYLMEGNAPSQALANVFARFKAWLTRIYQTVLRLKAPINDEIRGVFDRLIVTNPEKGVAEPPSFADLHETDAEAAAPSQARDVAGQIRAERDRVAARTLPEHQDARLEDVASRDGRLSAGGAQPDHPGNEAGPRPAEAAGGAPDGALGAGRTEAAAEGHRPLPEPTEPNQPFPRVETRLVDKAGNIRLENINAPDDVLEVLRESANRNNGFWSERRGIISDGEALSLSQALGEDPAFLDRKAIGSAYTKEEIFALENLLIKSATAVRDAMAGTDEVAYAEAKARHLMIHDMVQAKASAARAEAGRALQAFAALKRMKGAQEAESLQDWLKVNTGKTLFQLQQEMNFGSKLQTPQQVSKFINDSSKKNFNNAIIYYYVNALISGPVTHLRYSIGNAINAIWRPVVELPTAATIGALKEAAGLEAKNRVYYGEAAAQLFAITKGSRDGVRAAIEAFQSGVSPLLPNERVSAHFAEYTQPIPGKVGAAIGIPGRSVAAIHSFFKQLRYEQELQGLAYRKAMEENLSGDAFEGRVAQLMTSPTEDMMEASTRDSLKELFMAPTDYHTAMGALTRAVNSNLLAKIIVPFMKIGSQITRNAFIERTPLGLASRNIRDVFSEGGASADMQAAKMVTGVSLMGATVLMAAEGLATGDGPTDPKARAVWLLNHRPNSVSIGGVTMPYQGLGHLGMLMRFSANMYETGHYWDGEDGSKLAVAFFEGLTKSVIDENFLRGVKDLLDAVYHSEEYGASYLRNNVTNWIPWSVGLGQVARKVDPYQREAHTIFETARAKIPFYSEGLFPRRDRFGEPIPNNGGLPQYQNDPVVQLLEHLNMGIAQVPRKIRGVTLSEQQYDDFSRLAGRMTKMRLNAFANTPGIAQMPDTLKRKTITDIVDSARETARGMVLMQNSQIIKDATDKKIAPLRKVPAQ